MSIVEFIYDLKSSVYLSVQKEGVTRYQVNREKLNKLLQHCIDNQISGDGFSLIHLLDDVDLDSVLLRKHGFILSLDDLNKQFNAYQNILDENPENLKYLKRIYKGLNTLLSFWENGLLRNQQLADSLKQQSRNKIRQYYCENNLEPTLRSFIDDQFSKEIEDYIRSVQGKQMGDNKLYKDFFKSYAVNLFKQYRNDFKGASVDQVIFNREFARLLLQDVRSGVMENKNLVDHEQVKQHLINVFTQKILNGSMNHIDTRHLYSIVQPECSARHPGITVPPDVCAAVSKVVVEQWLKGGLKKEAINELYKLIKHDLHDVQISERLRLDLNQRVIVNIVDNYLANESDKYDGIMQFVRDNFVQFLQGLQNPKQRYVESTEGELSDVLFNKAIDQVYENWSSGQIPAEVGEKIHAMIVVELVAQRNHYRGIAYGFENGQALNHVEQKIEKLTSQLKFEREAREQLINKKDQQIDKLQEQQAKLVEEVEKMRTEFGALLQSFEDTFGHRLQDDSCSYDQQENSDGYRATQFGHFS